MSKCPDCGREGQVIDPYRAEVPPQFEDSAGHTWVEPVVKEDLDL